MKSLNGMFDGISRLGLGAWAIGGPYEYGWGPVDDENSIATIRLATELGLTWLDTAPAYGYGHSEVVIGNAIAKMSARPLIFTKCGRVWDTAGKVTSDLRPKSIREQWRQSVVRLRVDVIDLYQIHRPDTVTGTPIEDSWAELTNLRSEGKVRAIGLSNVSLDQYSRCATIGHVDAVQTPVNLMRPGDASLREQATKDGAVVLAYSPMESGLLSGTFDLARIASLPDGDWRKTSPKFSPESLDKAQTLIQLLLAISVRTGHSVPALAIAWALRQPGVTAAIVGARFPGQLTPWVDAGQIEVEDTEWRSLDEVVGVSGV